MIIETKKKYGWYHTCRSLVAKVHTLLKGFHPKRQSVQNAIRKISEIIYPVEDLRP